MREGRILIAIFLLALVLRLVLGAVREEVFLHRPFLLFGDEYKKSIAGKVDARWYDGTARAFLAGKGVASLSEDDINPTHVGRRISIQNVRIDRIYYAHTSIPPLYPVFLGICYAAGGMNTPAYFIPQAILGSLGCLLIYLLGKEIFGRKTAITAGIAAAVYPDLVLWTCVIGPETLFIFWLALGFLFLVKGNALKNIYLVYAGGIVFGLACLTRITLIPFIPALFIWEALFFSPDRGLNFKIAFFTVLIIILFLFPWAARNYIVFGEFTPFTSETKAVLWSTNKPDKDLEAERYCQLYKSPTLRTAMFIKDNFREYAFISMGRFVRFWSPFTVKMRKSARIYKGLTWLVIFPLAFYGMAVSLKDWRKPGLIVLFILYYSLLHAASYLDDGLVYRYPIQPFLCIFAAHGFWKIYERKA